MAGLVAFFAYWTSFGFCYEKDTRVFVRGDFVRKTCVLNGVK